MSKLLIGYVEIPKLSIMKDEDIRALDVINLAFGHVIDGDVVCDMEEAVPEMERIRAVNPEIRIVLSVGGWSLINSLGNLLFIQTGNIVATLGPIALHAGGVEAAVLYTVRFFLLLVAGSLLMLTTTPVGLTDALAWLLGPLERLGVSAGETALIISIALGLVPALSQEARDIVAAQTARGADLEGKGPIAYARACAPLLVPLFTSALRHAENLGRAMEARCYTGPAGRTHYHELRFVVRRDAPFALLAAAHLVTLVALFALGI